jgi:hypothetical protein
MRYFISEPPAVHAHSVAPNSEKTNANLTLYNHRSCRSPRRGEMRQVAFASGGILAAKSQVFHGGQRCGLEYRIVSVTAAKPSRKLSRVMAVASEEAVSNEEPATKFTRILTTDVTNGGWIVDAEVVNFKKKSQCVGIACLTSSRFPSV